MPLPEDNDPSFIISPPKNLWNCLAGCGGGDNLQLVMRLEKCSFRYAAEQLLKLLGLAPVTPTIPARMGTGGPCGSHHEILCAPGDGLSDAQLMAIVTDFYHTTFLNQPPAMQYLARRKCFHPEAVKRFKIGYANRTLGYRVPTTTAAGRELKARLQKLGVLRKETGHEHLNGSVVFPITDRTGTVVQLYGRKITDGLRKGTPLHLYLEAPKRGVWNGQSLTGQREWLLCESILDALTFWCAGFRNVTCSFGAGSVNEDLWALLHDARPRWLILAQDNDPAGNDAVAKLAPRLGELGIGVKRVQLPPGVDVNAYACQSADAAKALAALLEQAHVLVAHAADQAKPGLNAASPPPAAKEEKAAVADTTPESSPETAVVSADVAQAQPLSSLAASSELLAAASPPPAPPGAVGAGPACLHPEHKGEDIFFRLGEREYRVRGLSKNTSFEALKIALRVKRDEERHHQDNVDLNSAKSREAFLRAAAAETQLSEDILKRDLSRLLLKLEELQEELIRRALEPQGPVVPGLTDAERAEALALLKAPNLIERITEDFALRIVGERHNGLTGYLAAISRKLDKPLAVIIQSTSAAGKSSLMEAVLAFVPEEERIKYSAMTGQALFYLGEQDLKHKVLAIVEEEGAEKAAYALKLLQSEGELTIASTSKDEQGRLKTEEYRVEGPVMIFLTTTDIDIDEELLNRCLILTVDESREQTRAIHALQRQARTLEGLERKDKLSGALKLHQNAQRLLRPLAVVNPFANRLTFLDDKTRTRRDHEKYLTLMDAIALLHQHQRPWQRTASGREYIEVTLADIAAANQLAGEILGRCLDEMPPQTRRFLDLLWAMVKQAVAEKQIAQAHYRFSQRDARDFTGWTPMQVKRHLAKLAELEYVLAHRGTRGQTFVYELLYQGEGADGAKFLPGLIDVEKLRYDENRGGPNGERGTSGAAQGQAKGTGGAVGENATSPNADAAQTHVPKKQPRKSRPGTDESGNRKS